MGPHEVADRLDLELRRRLAWYGATEPDERAAVLALLAERVAAQRDAALVAAVVDATDHRPYAALAETLGVSRQALRQRVKRLRAQR